MARTFRGNNRGNQTRDSRPANSEPLSPEDFDRGPAKQTVPQGEMCSQCHLNPVLSWTVTYTRGGREFTETRFFFEGRPEDNAKLCSICSANKADAVVGKEMGNISRNIGSLITTITGNELAGHAYHAFGVNAPSIMQEVADGADIVNVVAKHLHELATNNNAWAEENERNDRRIVIPDDEETVLGAVALALSMKDGRLATVTNLIGDRLVAIEEKYPDQRFDIVITEARRMKVDVTLALVGVFIAEAKKAVEPYRNNTDGTALYERLMALDKERVAMSGESSRRQREMERSDFDLFIDGRRLYQQATQLQDAQQRRDTLKESYRGRFSSAFRAPTTATSDESDDVAPATIADDPENAAKLASVKGQLNDDEPDSVPADLSAAAETQVSTDETASVETDSPAAVENA